MKKNLFLFIFLPFIILLSACGPMVDKFKAETQEGISEPIEINKEQYETMINEDKSFILYISDPTCSGCIAFNKYLNPFIEETSIVIYKTQPRNIKTYIDYVSTPAISIIKDGEVINTINMYEDESYFKSTSNIKKFILRYVEL